MSIANPILLAGAIPKVDVLHQTTKESLMPIASAALTIPDICLSNTWKFQLIG